MSRERTHPRDQAPRARLAAQRPIGSPFSGIDGIVQHIKGVERERDQLRATIERVRGVLSGN